MHITGRNLASFDNICCKILKCTNLRSCLFKRNTPFRKNLQPIKKLGINFCIFQKSLPSNCTVNKGSLVQKNPIYYFFSGSSLLNLLHPCKYSAFSLHKVNDPITFVKCIICQSNQRKLNVPPNTLDL